MIIKTKDSVPQIYSDSYDMLLFFALLDGLQASSFLDISRVRGQHSPINCFEEDLKGLATCFDIPTLNRELLLNYRLITKYKGTEKAILAAFYFSGARNTVIYTLNGAIYVVADLTSLDTVLLNVLLDRWLPINVVLNILHGTDTSSLIIFNTNGGSLIPAISQDSGSVVREPVRPIKSLYGFVGWYSDEALTIPYTFTTMPSGNIIVYVKWNYVGTGTVISFDSNGGSPVAPVGLPTGSPISAPVTPTKEGYTFVDWYLEDVFTTRYVFNIMPPGPSFTLYARWLLDADAKTITFDTNGGSAVAKIVGVSGEAILEPSSPIKVGHTFGGWYSDAGLTTEFTFSTMPAENTLLYAKWTINQYSIYFDEPIPVITQDYASEVVAPTNPTYAGYTFAGWYTTPEVTAYTSTRLTDELLSTRYVFSTMPAMDINLWARRISTSYAKTITFDTNGGSAVAPYVGISRETITAPEPPTKDNYDFVDWYRDSMCTQKYTFREMPGYNLTLYAKWAAA
jgi:uncharacterized repeat protein (TIGR02543 family)